MRKKEITYYADVPMELAVRDVEEKIQKNKEYIHIGESHYSGLSSLSVEEYEQYKNNLDVNIDNLIVKSIPLVIKALAKIYVKYEIEDVVNFEDGLSYVLEHFINRLKEYKELPKFYSTYYNSVVNYYTFKFISRYYQKQKFYEMKVDAQSPSRMLWESDNKGGYDFPHETVYTHEIQEKLNSLMARFSERKRKIIDLRYGLTKRYSLIYDEIAKIEKVTRSRPLQIERSFLRVARIKGDILKGLKDYSDIDGLDV